MADKILATLTSKGQITLPAQHRKAWGLKPGDQIAFDPPGGKSVRIEPRRKRSIFERLDELKLPPLGRPLTQKDIDEFGCRGDGGEIRRAKAEERQVIGIDTNILLRIFETEDDPAQSSRARKAIEDNAPVYLHDVVLAEFVWTCRTAFKQSREAIHRRLQAIATDGIRCRPPRGFRARHKRLRFAEVGLRRLADRPLEPRTRPGIHAHLRPGRRAARSLRNGRLMKASRAFPCPLTRRRAPSIQARFIVSAFSSIS